MRNKERQRLLTMKETFGLATALTLLLIAVQVHAQWLNYPTPGIPRTPDGKPDLSAPVPRTADGKSDVSGLWQPSAGGYLLNITADCRGKFQTEYGQAARLQDRH